MIYPPVAIDRFFWKPDRDYLLIVSELVAYKRLDYAVRLCAQQGIRLKIAGDGPEFRRLKKLSGKSVEFCGRVSDGELRQLYSHSMALLVPGEEDFGMTMVEALASGKPVIALGRGGALEIVGLDAVFSTNSLRRIRCTRPCGAYIARVLPLRLTGRRSEILRAGVSPPHANAHRESRRCLKCGPK